VVYVIKYSFRDLFALDNIRDHTSCKKIDSLGGLDGLEKVLKTNSKVKYYQIRLAFQQLRRIRKKESRNMVKTIQ
jgi:hypothetical protein